MSVFVVNFPCCALWKSKKLGFIKPSTLPKQMSPSSSTKVRLGNNDGVNAFFFNPTEEPILREALKEPVAFMGGMFAGLLRLDLNEDPLKDWVSRTVEASGITEEEIDASGLEPEEEVPLQIEIE
ncbi:hypothetical protein PRUPE_5G245400 [Prunus persica]|uniref:PREDICTED: UPF0426 n=2 Tax=Prunus TaxID=3754 RepID=A0A5E4EW02_PRUDU|nr:UPF0426 protein At1g28150, chloroplastic [Prunus persica]XP_034217738.1 UPF0426 protein At1g28150, chloroplastic [Prunus dulcis]ONI09573.1 hypothetical protein PRUPE_5G245400 [Prunus persica]VVA19662.1 PREDICTED: UPF0426 [Prunus dulcis]